MIYYTSYHLFIYSDVIWTSHSMSILIFFILNLIFTCRPDLLLLDGKKSLFSAIGFIKFDLLNNANVQFFII